MKQGAALLCCTLLVLAGCTSTVRGQGTVASARSGAATAPSSEPSESLDLALPPAEATSFTDCTAQIRPQIAGADGGDRDLTFECGTLPVPLDYADPTGEQIGLGVIRARLGGQDDRISSLVVNPGGPGGSGTLLAVGLALSLPLDVLEHFDIVGFDPRGVGQSTSIHCLTDDYKTQIFDADPYVDSSAQFAVQAEIAATIAGQCDAKYGPRLGLFNTINTARDMDQLRESLGDDALTYLGYSYGTTLGSVYATMFPTHVRALVLDGAVDPTLDDIDSVTAQAKGFQSAFDAFAADCVAHACPAGPDPQATVTALLAAARAAPIPSSAAGASRPGTIGLLYAGVLSALYSEDDWPALGEAVGAARDGDAAKLISLADAYNGRQSDGSYDNRLDANLTINCADDAETFSDEQVQTLSATLALEYPLFGGPVATNVLVCSAWQADRYPLPARSGVGGPPIMVVGTTNDPATPYTGAQHLTSALGTAFLVTWQGEGHTAYPKTTCISDTVDAYLISLTVPPADPVCPLN